MKEALENKIMILFIAFIFVVLFINVNDNQKNVSAENTNNANYLEK